MLQARHTVQARMSANEIYIKGSGRDHVHYYCFRIDNKNWKSIEKKSLNSEFGFEIGFESHSQLAQNFRVDSKHAMSLMQRVHSSVDISGRYSSLSGKPGRSGWCRARWSRAVPSYLETIDTPLSIISRSSKAEKLTGLVRDDSVQLRGS